MNDSRDDYFHLCEEKDGIVKARDMIAFGIGLLLMSGKDSEAHCQLIEEAVKFTRTLKKHFPGNEGEDWKKDDPNVNVDHLLKGNSYEL